MQNFLLPLQLVWITFKKCKNAYSSVCSGTILLYLMVNICPSPPHESQNKNNANSALNINFHQGTQRIFLCSWTQMLLWELEFNIKNTICYLCLYLFSEFLTGSKVSYVWSSCNSNKKLSSKHTWEVKGKRKESLLPKWWNKSCKVRYTGNESTLILLKLFGFIRQLYKKQFQKWKDWNFYSKNKNFTFFFLLA